MEETLGKRIVANRKRLGLTQDRLAEQLGVTAQAVSKWENDQSYPDITMLPKLAEIFGISIDGLLGVTTPEPAKIHEAEVLTQDMDNDEESKIPNSAWEVHWNSGKKGSLAMAVWVLLVGGVLMAGNLLHWNVGFWDILWPSALVVFGLSNLLPKFSFFSLGCALFGGYFLLDNLNLLPITLGKNMLLPIFLLLFGLSLLVDAIRKPNKGNFTVTHNGNKINKSKSEYHVEDEGFSCSTSFGENTHFVQLDRLSHGTADVSFGELTVDLTQCAEVTENCHIEANCSFGELIIQVPQRFRVDVKSSTAFSSVEFRGTHTAEPQGVISLEANASFGEIQVCYL